MILAGAILAAIPVFTQLPLNDAIARTVANSAAVASAQSVVRQRQAQLRLARIGGIPHITGDYSLSPQAAPSGTSTVEQHFFTVGAGVSVNDLLAAGAIRSQAAAQLVSAQRDADASVLQARTNAITLYFSALQTIAVAGVRADAVRGAARQLDAANLRASAGAAPQLDVVRADVALAQAQADGARADADRANAVAALASAANVGADSLVARSAAPVPSPPPLNETRAVARALATRPELASLSASLEAQTAALALARQTRWPIATVAAGYQAGVDTAVPVHGPQAAVHLELPLSTGTSDRIAIVQAQIDAVRAQLNEQRRTIALDVAAAVRTVRAAQYAQAAAQRARDEARRALAAVELGYREGASSSLDVDVARRTYVSASVDALVAQYQYAAAAATLEALLL